MIKYDKLFERLKAEGKAPTSWLRAQGMHPNVVDRLRKNGSVKSETIDRLCSLLDCQPGDITEYVPDE